MDSGGLKEPLLDGVHIPAQQRQQPIQQPFIQVALDELVPEKKTFTHLQPVSVAIIQHL